MQHYILLPVKRISLLTLSLQQRIFEQNTLNDTLHMKNSFIKLRFDRMKNLDILILYKNILLIVDEFGHNLPELEKSVEILRSHEPNIYILDTKQKKRLHTKEITSLRAHVDKLVAAIMLQIKAIRYAKLDEDTPIMSSLSSIESILKGFKPKNRFIKEGVFIHLNSFIKNHPDEQTGLGRTGIMRYINKINEIYRTIDKLSGEQYENEKKKPAPHSTMPAREKTIEMLRFFLQSIDILKVTHNESDYTHLIKSMSGELIDARKQLRNTTTRRIRKKAREEAEVAI